MSKKKTPEQLVRQRERGARYRAKHPATPEQLARKRQQSAEWRKQNPDYMRQWKARNPNYMGRWREQNFKAYWLMRSYGITLEEWERLFEIQGRRCAICRAIEHGGKHDWSTDHDHAKRPQSGRPHIVRGILCHKCNTGLGFFRDNPELLRAALAYLLRDEGKGG